MKLRLVMVSSVHGYWPWWLRKLVAAFLGLGAIMLAVTLVPIQAAFAAGADGSLSAGQVLASGQSISSPNGTYQLIMQTNGNLVEYGPSGAVWATGTPASGNHATMQTDGNLVVYTSSGAALWQSGTGGESGGFVLELQDNGNLVIEDNGVPIWARESSLSAGSPDQALASGQSIWSPNGTYEFIMQTDGNLVEYAHGSALWASDIGGQGNHVTMQTDGNLVVYTSGGTAVWQSGTGGNSGGFVLDVQNDGNVVIYGVHGGAIWNREEGDGYPYLGATNCSATYGYDSWCLVATGNDNSSYGYGYRNCTDYVAWKIAKVLGVRLPNNLGFATTWGTRLHKDGYSFDSTPRVGDIAWWQYADNGLGHVAYVYAVNKNGVASLDEYNAANTGLFSSNRTTASIGAPTAYIHIGTP